jgi:phosphatidylglycerol:prolipoprotein diacylglycerol transferase
MSPGLVLLVKTTLWIASIILVVSSMIYGRKISKQGEATSKMMSFGAIGGVVAFIAFKLGLGGQMGRGTGIPLHTYGLLIATGFLVAIWLAARESQRAFPEMIRVKGKMERAGPIMRERMLDLGFWILIAGIVGSRLLFIIVNWRDYQNDFSKAFSIEGGLVFYGGFIGALLASIYYCRANQIPFLRMADVCIPSVAIGHAIGRLGCLSAGCCWGDIAKAGSKIAIRFPAAKHLPFGGFNTDSLAYQDQLKDRRWVDALGHIYDHSVSGAQQISAYAQQTGFTMPVYPTQLMESVGELILFLVLISMRRAKRFQGQLLAVWLMGYSIVRCVNELFRGDAARGYLFRYPQIDPFMLSTSQTISLGMFLTGVAIWVLYGRKAREPMPAVT